MATTEQPKLAYGTVPKRDNVAVDTVLAFLAATGLAEWTPIRVFVEGSPCFATSPIARAWIDFEIDENHNGRWFRVTYTLLRSSTTDDSWHNDNIQLICVSPSGIPHHDGITVGVK